MRRRHPAGMTLIELIVVLVVLVALAGIVIPLVSTVGDDARLKTTRTTMTNLRAAVAAFYLDMNGVPFGPDPDPLKRNNTGVPNTLMDLVVQPDNAPAFDPLTGRGWRGPYVSSATGSFAFTKLDPSYAGHGPFAGPAWNDQQGDPAFLDGWGKPLLLQWPLKGDLDSTALQARAKYTRLISAGPSSDYTPAIINTPKEFPMPLPAQRGNDIVVFLRTQDLFP